ncbi:O-Methyltransferase involved in polyketide biosynthesis [[Actinomadura] parvosata subsp. kistnae]|uniref:SAM-dependent methyltransferase n=1 Tax=[Actinomadura] parvosata TaxID=1955412 RepID=UPI000D2D77FE|nr:O-Methyltransferase involved in polyketide biosynthesis [Actinomadura parvosata subsp. kistnae]
MSTPSSLAGIAETSIGVAAIRAMEDSRADRLFHDPYAERFVQAAGGDGYWDTAPTAWAGFVALMGEEVAVRTRYFDEELLRAAADGCEQVVLLAAGMDARAYRLSWPEYTRVFEIDVAEVLAFKSAVLKDAEPACERVEVSTDLRLDWPLALREAGFVPGVPTAWLIEGILYALTPEAADGLLARVTSLSAPGSVVAFEHVPDSPALRAARQAISAEMANIWLGGPEGEPGLWLRRHGWTPQVRDISEVAATYGRPVPAAFDPSREGSGPGWLGTARLAKPE